MTVRELVRELMGKRSDMEVLIDVGQNKADFGYLTVECTDGVKVNGERYVLIVAGEEAMET